MNTQDLLTLIEENSTVTITIDSSLVAVVKKRVSNLRSRQQVELAEFADGLRLDYMVLPSKDEGKQRLRISLVGKGKSFEVDGIEIGEDF